MDTYKQKIREGKSEFVENEVAQKRNNEETPQQFLDYSAKGVTQTELQKNANSSSRVAQLNAFQETVNSNSETILGMGNAMQEVVQRVPFTQPPSRDIKNRAGEVVREGDDVLGGKCYAYSAFNALAQVGKTPRMDGEEMTQEEVDTWIRDNERDTTGGGPQMAAGKLSETGMSDVSFRRLNRKLRSATEFALSNQMPVSIGVSKPSNHWIYATGTDGKQILAEDQQNANRGTIRFNYDDGKWIGVGDDDRKVVKTVYEISKFEVGYSNEEEYLALDRFY